MLFPRNTCISLQMTESHNLRRVEVGRDLQRPSRCIPRLKAVPTRTGGTAHCPVRFQVPSRKETTTSPGKLFPVVEKTHSRKTQYLTLKKWGVCVFRQNFLYVGLCPLPLVLSLGTSQKSLIPSPSRPPSSVYTHCEDTLSLLFSRLNSPSSPKPLLVRQLLQSHHHPCGPRLNLLQHVHVFPYTEEPSTGRSTPDMTQQ